MILKQGNFYSIILYESSSLSIAFFHSSLLVGNFIFLLIAPIKSSLILILQHTKLQTFSYILIQSNYKYYNQHSQQKPLTASSKPQTKSIIYLALAIISFSLFYIE
jgi:hypothetical protein